MSRERNRHNVATVHVSRCDASSAAESTEGDRDAAAAARARDTDVNRASERVSILLKDSFAETFAKADRPFIRAFCETQMFDAFADDALREDE